MDYFNAFWFGGLVCALIQILLDKTKLMPGRVMVLLVCSGALLSAVGVYRPLVDFAGAGASVPLIGFGHVLWEGMKKAIEEDGIIIRRRPPEIRKASCNGIAGCRSHTASHVHGIPETVIHHTAGSKASDSSTAFAGAQRSFFSGRRCT